MAQFSKTLSNRLFSLDVFRGLIMFLLIAEAAGFHESFAKLTEGSAFYGLALQLQHHPWNGLRFWDLVQPFFMFIVGVAMPFSMKKRLASGNRKELNKHIVQRCAKLLFFGVLLHCVYSHGLVWELWNVLVQLAFTIAIAYAIMKRSHRFQILFSVGLLILTEFLYRSYNPTAPYAQGHEHFGAWVDLMVMGKVNDGYWVFVNFIPTAAHTIWGVVCGQLLLSKRTGLENVRTFVIWGLAALILGYGMDLLDVTPIIKRIATTSFTLASGGIAILVLALFYWAIDVMGYKKRWLHFFAVVGTNSIFIYLFSETFGHLLFREFELLWSTGLFHALEAYKDWILVVEALLTLFLLWAITYYLDKRKIYFKV
jgi:predicted acyltransferase